MSDLLTTLACDSRQTLKALPDKSVHCVVTSPPYWGLRDYGVSGQIGLEKSLDDFMAQMLAVFAELWRVLRDDGTCWLNLGDAYAGGGHGGGGSFARDRIHLAHKNEQAQWRTADQGGRAKGFRHKDLLGLPWRVAFALQAAGWYLRSDIIWHKPNPMPESVTDRPTKSHEYIFLLAKSPKYFYDAEAIKEASVEANWESRYTRVSKKSSPTGERNGIRNGRPGNKTHRGLTAYEQGDERHRTKSGLVKFAEKCREAMPSKRNKRSVWTVTSAPFKGAHFATFPPELIRPCILAGTSAHGCCAECGAPYARVIEKGEPDRAHQRACGGDANGEYKGQATKNYTAARAQDASATKARILAGMVERKTVGWRATCKCAGAVVPCTVLDPFGGAFTTAYVALQEKRRAIMCELNPEYIAIGQKRCENIQPPNVKRVRRQQIAAEQLSLLAA